MKRILLSDWLPEQARWARARWAYLSRSGFPAMVPQEKFSFWPYDNTVSDQACLLMMAAYWSCSFLRFYWTRVSLGHNNAKMNLANIQPSWSHAWSITRIYQKWILTWIRNLRQHVRAIKEQAIVFEYLQCWRKDPSLIRVRGYFSLECSLVAKPYWRAPKRAKQLSMATIPLCFEFFPCRFYVLQS